MWAIDRWLPMHSDRSLVRTVIALAPCGLAVAILVAAIVGFRKARTTVDPMHPEAASAIVSALIPLIFVLYMNRFQIAPEERALHSRFGAPYETYLRSVRRWI